MKEFKLSDEAKLILHEDGSAELFKSVPAELRQLKAFADQNYQFRIELTPLEVSRLLVAMQEYDYLIEETPEQKEQLKAMGPLYPDT